MPEGQRTGNEKCPTCGATLRDLGHCTSCGWGSTTVDQKLLDSLEKPKPPEPTATTEPANPGAGTPPAPEPGSTSGT